MTGQIYTGKKGQNQPINPSEGLGIVREMNAYQKDINEK